MGDAHEAQEGIGVASSYPAWPPLLQSNLNIFDGRNVKEKSCQKSFHFACRALNSFEKIKRKGQVSLRWCVYHSETKRNV
jgi:hypothetical protein